MIVTMAYDEDLANRIRELIASEDGYTEQKMFGGIGFMIDGHMALGVSGQGGLMIHCSKDETEALLAKPGARPFEMRGREMKGWLRVDAESVSTKRALEPAGAPLIEMIDPRRPVRPTATSAKPAASPARTRPAPSQPYGRAPARRGIDGD